MADIDIQRKRAGLGWLAALLGVVVLALVLWWLLADRGEEVEVADVPVAEPVAPVAETPVIPVARIVAAPASFVGQRVSGEARVVEVPTDRGFWIEDQGQRLFVILNDAPTERPLDVNTGQTVRLTEAMVYGPQNLGNIPRELDPDTRAVAEGQPAVLAVDQQNVQVLERPG